ncbi:glutaminase family protein [Fodinicola feengrottensis]
MSRRNILRAGSIAGLSAAAVPVLGGTAFAQPGRGQNRLSTFEPIRPPATPLAVRSPYLSTWLASDSLPGTWPSFWTGRTTAMTGIVRIDGVPYVFMGAPAVDAAPVSQGMSQISLVTTATRSTFTLTGGGVELVVTFLSPIEPGDLRRQSAPLSYLSMRASSADGKAHAVSVYIDVSAEWAHGDSGTKVGWASASTSGVRSLTVTPSAPSVLAENGDMASWGTVVWSTPERSGLTWQIGEDQVVRAAAVQAGKLAGTTDPNQPRAIGDHWPVLGLNLDFGRVSAATDPFVVSIGHVRQPAMRYLGAPLQPLWTSYWPSWQDMVAAFHTDFVAASGRASTLDNKVTADARAVGGDKYAALCALAVRQAYGGTELVVRDGKPWAFLKEISSDGNVSTVDVTYPGMPIFLYLDPQRLGLLLAPLLDYAENGGWPKDYAEHDLGSHYPDAAGHNDGQEEDMPVEESANMLIMTAGYLARLTAADAKTFAAAHYPILKRWADYLVGNALDPGLQNQTDDFTGWIAHSVNLALKGIVGVGAMSRISTAAQNAADATHYLSTARDYIGQWATMGQDGAHLRLAYDQPNTWSQKYNGYPDQLLGLGLISSTVADHEAAWYLAHRNQYGVPLDLRHSYTKTDWELWTAAWQHRNAAIRDALITDVYNFANTTPNRVPFTDWYDTLSGRQQGFQARPVIGGVFALLTLPR